MKVSKSKTWEQIKKTVLYFLNPKRSRRGFYYVLVFSMTALTVAHCLKHIAFKTHAYDLTFLHQSLFYPIGSGGRLLANDLSFWGSYLGDHLSFSLYVLTPLTAWIHSDYFVFLIQSLLIASSIYALVVWGPLKKQSKLWLFALIIILSQRALRNAVVWDFREDDLLFLFLSFMILSLHYGKIFYYILFFSLALLTKENVGPVLPFVAIPIMWDRSLKLNKNQRITLSLMTILASIAWTAICFKLLIPYFNHDIESSNNIVLRFPGLGNTPQEILIRVLTSPAVWWMLLKTKVLNWVALKYMILLLAPCAGLIYYAGKRAWLWIFPILPGVAMNLLSTENTQKSLEFHYDLIIIPFLIYMALRGALKLTAKPRSPAVFAVLLLVALGSSGRWPVFYIQKYFPTLQQWKDAHALEQLGRPGTELAGEKNLIIASGPWAMAHLSHIRELRSISAYDSTLWDQNIRDRTQIPGHTAAESNVIVLDLENPGERSLAPTLAGRGWKKYSVESTGSGSRFEIWQLKSSSK